MGSDELRQIIDRVGVGTLSVDVSLLRNLLNQSEALTAQLEGSLIMAEGFKARVAELTAQLAEARESERAAAWVYPKSIDDMPIKPGKEAYEYVPCLIVRTGEILSRPWNCEHQVFDNEDQDDFYCDWDQITAYMDLSGLIKAYAPPVTGEPA